MVTSAALLPLASLGARLQADTLGEPKVLLSGSLTAGLHMHPPVDAQILLSPGTAGYGQHMTSKFTPEFTLQRALPHARRAAGV